MGRPFHERRRRVVVDRDLQVRLVGRMAAAFLGTLLFFLAMSLGAPLVLGSIARVPEWGFDTFLFRVRLLASFVALPLFSGVLVLFAVGIRSTFGVAGPLYRFRQVFRDLAALRLPRGVRIRRGDTLQETARMFDAALVALHDQVGEVERAATQASSACRELEARVEGDPEVATALAALNSELAALERAVARFQLLPHAPYDEASYPFAAASAALPPVEPQPTSSS